MTKNKSLFLHEIYESIQGESIYAGMPCVFIRLSECPLRCKWCDTAAAFKRGKEHTIDEIIESVTKFNAKSIEVTGGEPLSQKNCRKLLEELVTRFPDKSILLETSGSEPIDGLPEEVHIIMDIKCPDSNMSKHNLFSNLDYLTESDELKFVIASEDDFMWAKQTVEKFALTELHVVNFSPAWGLMKPDRLSELILEHKLDVRLNLQLHKYIWSPRAKGV